VSGIMAWVSEYEGLLQWLGGLSLLLFVATLVIFPLIIIQLPADYFIRDCRDPAYQSRRHPAVWFTLMVLKNLLGVALILAGLAMLVLPGQGLLTILIGLTLVNFPGKFALERRMVRRPRVSKTLNRIRARAGKPPLEIPPSDDQCDEPGNGSD